MQDKYHLIGINGIGMSALAHLLREQNKIVSGSDVVVAEISEILRKKGVTFFCGHKKEQVEKETIVVYSSAIAKDNPELLEAQKLGCKILHRSDLLLQLMQNQKKIAIAGTHGKTTTTALLFSVLKNVAKTNLAMGGEIIGLNQSGVFQNGEVFVFEADESDRSFLKYMPDALIVTNVEKEHMENYASEEDLQNSFATICRRVDPNFLVLCADDPFLEKLPGIHYGFSQQADARIENYTQKGFTLAFDLVFRNKRYTQIELKVIGTHNAKNAAAVFVLCLQLGISEEKIREGLLSFQGVKRRTEITYDNEVLFIDDYAHHPSEVLTTLQAIRVAVGPRKLNVIFQPHRFSRMREHFHDFAKAFWPASKVYLTNIYAASEPFDPSIDLELLQKKIEKESKVICLYCKDFSLEEIEKDLESLDVVVTMGAGNVTAINQRLKERLKEVKKPYVGLVYGGPSYEHEISCKSFAFVKNNISKKFFNLEEFFIDKHGVWYKGEEKKLCTDLLHEFAKIDVFFPVMHGAIGEDGRLQAFFEVLQKAYAGPDYCSAMIAMDKVLTKQLLEQYALPTPKYVHFTQAAWRKDPHTILQQVQSTFSFPIYVKPVHLGSSIGITKVEIQKEIEEAIHQAFLYDDAVLVEQGLVNCRELEFAVMGDANFCIVTAPGEKLAQGQFVDYEKKYEKPVATKVQAELSQEMIEKGKALAEKVFFAVRGNGIMRVDFLLDAKGNFTCFEVNSIPGLTVNSLYPKMMDAAGIKAEKLLEICILMGLERKRKSVSLC